MTDLITLYKRDVKRRHKGKLPPDEQAALAREGRYDELADSLLPLVLWHLQDFMTSRRGMFSVDEDIRYDLVQAGNLAVLNAVRSWNPDADPAVALSSWVSQYIRRDMKREFTKQRQVLTKVYEESVMGITPNAERLVSISGNVTPEDLLPDGLFAPDDVEESAEALERTSMVRQLLNTLPERQRRALELTELEGLSCREAGEVLDISQQAVSKLRIAGLAALRLSISTTDGRHSMEDNN